MDRYFGTYHAFSAVSDKESAYLLSADNLVGDEFAIDLYFENGTRVSSLTNRFDRVVGHFDGDFARQLSLFEAKGWVSKAYLTYVAYTEDAHGGRYWGEMALISYDPRLGECFEGFTIWLQGKLREGVRPPVDFDKSAVDKLLASHGTWRPEHNLPAVKSEKGTAIMKSSLSLSDKAIERSRKGGIGCYVVSWATLIAIIALIVFVVSRIV